MTDLIVLGRTGTDGTVIAVRMKCRVAGDNWHQTIPILPVMTMIGMIDDIHDSKEGGDGDIYFTRREPRAVMADSSAVVVR